MKKSKIYLLQGNMFYNHVFKQNLQHLGYSDITCFRKASAMLENSNTPPDIIIYDFDVDCYEGEKIVRSLTGAFPNAYLLFSCSRTETHLIPQFMQSGAFDCFIKDQYEMKSVENIFESIRRKKLRTAEKLLANISQKQVPVYLLS